jgi:cardiolipin synthase
MKKSFSPAALVFAAAALAVGTPSRSQTPAAASPAAAGPAAQMFAYASEVGYPLTAEELRDILEKTSVAGAMNSDAALAELKRRAAARAPVPAAAAAPSAPRLSAAGLDRMTGALTAPGGLDRAFDQSGSPVSAAAVPAPPLSLAPPPASANDALRLQVQKALASNFDSAIFSLSDAALAAASSDQKVALIKTFTSRASSHQQDDSGYKDNCENFVVKILSSVSDDAAFDRIYYRVSPGTLKQAFPFSKIAPLVAKHQASAKPGDWANLEHYVDVVADTKSSGKNFVEFLIDGAGAIGPGMAVIESGKSSIHIEVFQLQGDEVGWAVGNVLAAKAKAGVHVRMLIDANGSSTNSDADVKKLLDFLRAAGAEVIVKPIPIDQSHLDHRKVMVVDGDSGFTGGMNIGKLYQMQWHDQQTYLSGPAVAGLQDAFLERWAAAGGKIPVEELPSLYPPLTEDPSGSVVRVVRHQGGDSDENIKAMYLRAFLTAQTSIRIANPYFLDADIVAGLVHAAGRPRKVKVQVVLPQDNDVAVVQRGSRAFYPDLLAAGVEIYEYQGRMAHEKVAVIDGRWATAGSSNLDSRSLRNNDELNIMISDPAVARYIGTFLFDADMKKSVRIKTYTPTLRERLDRALLGDQL